LRVAALYDVHGNVHALEAVVAEVADADVVLFGGDLASGPLPRETIDLARSVGNAQFLLGNADVLSSPVPPEWEEARRWVEAQLGDEYIEWLANLPFSWTADETLYVHANPVDYFEVVTERTAAQRVRELLDGVAERRVVTGHVHIQYQREVDGTLWVGAGSVGMPYADRPGAYWALLTPDAVELRRTDYDLERAAAAIRASGYPKAEELAAENVLACPTVDEALAVLSP
jgi:diadenosine tetraphosphatase ApaH/serine/threonine PP2A family protein phosphatase